MNEQKPYSRDDDSDEIEIPVAEFLPAIWAARGFVIGAAVVGLVLAIGLALVLPVRYSSTTTIMTPDAQSFSASSVLTVMGAGSLPSLGGGLLNSRNSGDTAHAVLISRTVQEDIVRRFNLMEVYKVKRMSQACSKLQSNTKIAEDKVSGTIAITVEDGDKQRAQAMTAAYLHDLDGTISRVSTSSSRRERIFLEDRLKTIKVELDSSEQKLGEFASRNATLDPHSQTQETANYVTRIQGQLLADQSELSGLRMEFGDENVKVQDMKARISELQHQLSKVGGAGPQSMSSEGDSNGAPTSLRRLPSLSMNYMEIYRQVSVLESLYETLTKQYELARVQEAKEIATVRVLDDPSFPETKSSPHRTIITVSGLLLGLFFSVLWVVIRVFRGESGNPPSFLHPFGNRGATASDPRQSTSDRLA
jgi:uncharacterized protein involved in exopolysaccharide biosynthesis